MIDMLIRGGEVVGPDGSSSMASVLVDRGRITEIVPGPARPTAVAIAITASVNSMPRLLLKNPFFQWALPIAMNIAPNPPAAPSGVRNPNISDSPPPTSPRIFRYAQNRAGLNPWACNPCSHLAIPGPPNQPKSFCAPCAARISPPTRRRMSRAIATFAAIEAILAPFFPGTHVASAANSAILHKMRSLPI